MRAVIAAQRLCFAATVTPDGRPNLSPKGTIRVWDDQHLFFCDIASPGTRANLLAHPWIEVNIVDTASRRGYRFLGRASLHTDDEVYRVAIRRLEAEEGHGYQVASVVLIAVERALPLYSPGYQPRAGRVGHAGALERTPRRAGRRLRSAHPLPGPVPCHLIPWRHRPMQGHAS